MQTWAKRGLQTALVTGGLLMLGTGIASADENVSPDTPAGPVDVAVTVPVEIDNNALGLPGGQVDSPLNYKGEIGTGHITLLLGADYGTTVTLGPVTTTPQPASTFAPRTASQNICT